MPKNFFISPEVQTGFIWWPVLIMKYWFEAYAHWSINSSVKYLSKYCAGVNTAGSSGSTETRGMGWQLNFFFFHRKFDNGTSSSLLEDWDSDEESRLPVPWPGNGSSGCSSSSLPSSPEPFRISPIWSSSKTRFLDEDHIGEIEKRLENKQNNS